MRHVALLILVLSLGFILAPAQVHASLGVGVGTSRVQVDEPLRSGGIYELPSIAVFNTGDVPAEYQMSISYHEGQQELQPDEEWVHFSPEKFALEPGESAQVDIELYLPLRLQPGEYFAYIEASPISESEEGESTVGIAAATQMNFTVEPGSFWVGVYYRVAGIWAKFTPWTYVGSGVLVAALFVVLFRKKFQIAPRRRRFKHYKS